MIVMKRHQVMERNVINCFQGQERHGKSQCPSPLAAKEIEELWMEYEENSSLEAKVVKDFDKVTFPVCSVLRSILSL